MPTLALDDMEMYYESRGDGTPLLLLHGGLGRGADWPHVFPTDPEGHRLIVPDLRGHGRSINPGGTFTFRQCAEDVVALLDHLQLPRVAAIGMSMGAKTLLHVATRYADRVHAMVLVSATPYFPAPARVLMAQYTPEAFEALSPDARAALRARHAGGDDHVRQLYAMTLGFSTSHDDMAFTPPLLATIRARTLIVHGDRDPLYPVELAVEMYRSIPGAALWVVPGGGHGPIFGPLAPAFAQAALDHVRRSDTPTA